MWDTRSKSGAISPGTSVRYDQSVSVAGIDKLLLWGLFICAAFPFRIWLGIGPLRSFSLLDLSVILSGSYLVVHALRYKPVNIGDRVCLLLLSVPLLAALVSFFWSVDPASTLRAVFINTESFIAFIAVTHFSRNMSSERLIHLAAGFLALLLVAPACMYLAIPGFSPQVQAEVNQGDYLSFYTRLSHPFIGRSNNLASVMSFFIFPIVVWAWVRKSFLMALVAMITMIALLLTLSRGVMLAVLLTALVAAFMSRKVMSRLVGVSLFLMPLLVIIAIWIVSHVPIAARYIESRMSLDNVNARSGLLLAALENIELHPLLGAGAGAVGSLDGRLVDSAHNAYVEMMVDYGVPLGMLCAASLILVALRLRRMTVTAQKAGDGVESVWLSVLCQLMIFMTEASYEGAVLKVIFFMSAGWGVAMINASRASLAGAQLNIRSGH